jgi:hypothetical protein
VLIYQKKDFYPKDPEKVKEEEQKALAAKKLTTKKGAGKGRKK